MSYEQDFFFLYTFFLFDKSCFDEYCASIFLYGRNVIDLIYHYFIPLSVLTHRNMQNTQGSENHGSEILVEKNLWDTAVALQKEFGFGIFFDGISPKLLRATVNHSVTFFVYDLILRSL